MLLLPPNLIMQGMGDRLAAAFLKKPDPSSREVTRGFMDGLWAHSPAGTLSLLVQMDQNIAENMPAADKMQSIWNEPILNLPLPFNFNVDNGHGKRFRTTWRQIKLASQRGDREATNIVQDIKAQFNRVWQARGYYALTELLADRQFVSNRKMDWDLIAEVLDLDRNQVANQVRSAVGSYLQNRGDFLDPEIPPYIELLQQLASVSNFAKNNGAFEVWILEMHSVRTLPWGSGESLYTQLKAANLQLSPEARKVADFLAGKYLMLNPTIANLTYQKIFLQRVSGAHDTMQDPVKGLLEIHNQTVREMGVDKMPYFPIQSQIEMGSGLDLTLQQKQKWFETLLLRPGEIAPAINAHLDSEYFKWASSDEKVAHMGFDLLKDLQAVTGAFDLLLKLRESPQYAPRRQNANTDHSNLYWDAIRRLTPDLLKELQSSNPQNITQLRRQIGILRLPNNTNVSRVHSNAAQIRNLRDTFVRIIGSVQLSFPERYELFVDLTASGTTEELDRYFENEILPNLKGPRRADHIAWLLRSHRVRGGPMCLSLAKELLEPRILQLAQNRPPSRTDLKKLTDDLATFTPQGSLAKDKFLESIGLRLRLRRPELNGFIEDQKSQNWRNLNPLLVNAGSVLSGQLRDMSVAQRMEFIRFLMNPYLNQRTFHLPPTIVAELLRLAQNSLLTTLQKAGSAINLDEIHAKAKELAEEAKLQLESLLYDSTPMERIPLVEILLSSGPNALLEQHNAPYNVLNDLLGYAPGSDEETMVAIYLKIIPEWEPGASLNGSRLRKIGLKISGRKNTLLT